ncbi:putative pentatricopeptide repeat-containing protein At3g16710, mitochondrial isoform X2 [Raphanus sativus]|uniref:Pentatricopeptide repeat-containing protein At3g16710, mitochondrial isoform X2 n=1 Tax=Raphanus sativus TaxID=3726 RepID=A0A9W3C275_RAPSA|nr:putative pentatricopeptide repeat-containing protein At3g16710, mitochondrial isoform X2 [Raphanus sativus]
MRSSIAKRFLLLPLHKHRLHTGAPPSTRLCASRAFSNHRQTLRTDLNNLHNLNEALDLFTRMSLSRPLPSLGDFTRLLTAIAAMEDDEEDRNDVVISLFDQMRNLGVSPLLYTCNIVINSLSKSSLPHHTPFAFLGKMTKLGFEPDVFTFTSLLTGLCYRNRLDDAVALFVKMVEIGCCCKPNVVTYTTLIHCLCKNRHVDHALDLFNQMETNGVRANVVTFNALVTGLCDCGRWGDLALLLREMIERRVRPNVVTFTALIDAFAKAGKVLDAVELFQGMSVEPNVVTYNSLINGFCKHGRLDEGMKMLDLMERKGCVPDMVTYTTLIHGFCKSKRVEDGVRLFNEMSLKGLAANTVTYTVFIQGYCLVGKPDVAQEVFNQMGSSRDIRTYNVLLDGLCCNGKVEKALMIFEEMREREMDVSIVTYTIVIQGMCKARANS